MKSSFSKECRLFLTSSAAAFSYAIFVLSPNTTSKSLKSSMIFEDVSQVNRKKDVVEILVGTVGNV